MAIRFTRRDLLIITAGALGYAKWNGYLESQDSAFPVRRVGANREAGHLLRGEALPEPREFLEIGTVIVGGGIAGLSAAWKLQKRGYRNFVVLDLENDVGGNSSYGENAATPYPWGAHYIPLPTEGLHSVRELFEELKIIQGYSGGLPIYDERYLCHEPHERLFIDGKWQESLIPEIGVSDDAKAEIRAFLDKMKLFRESKGKDGKRAFALPIDNSSRDVEFLLLDKISMRTFLDNNGWKSPELGWYVDYCCRDDFGTTVEQTSAWAAIHYFASRGGQAANAEVGTVLTWPEGNGWIVRQLKGKLAGKLHPKSLVYRVSESLGRYTVDYFDIAARTTRRYIADAVIYASPRFTAARVLEPLQNASYIRDFSYSPWLVANVSLNRLPKGKGAPLAWDNVPYNGESLGYVVATHQNVSVYRGESVITCYFPLTRDEPKAARKAAEMRTDREWANHVLEELEIMHPNIGTAITGMEYWLWGHGMVRPVPGFIWGAARQASLKPLGNIFFAHSDMSGLSLFEEAQFRGVEAADAVLKAVGNAVA